ncbi:MAG: hypothetical protein OER88_09410 [Planctomycetota bacterium]|nr:hypothetical protein [Planctomycetota bacterium]
MRSLIARVVGLAFLALALPAHATSLSETSIFELIGRADPIVVAKVLRVVDVPAGDRGQTVKVAEAEVLEWIKSGGARPKRIWYLAEGTRDADQSTAFKGEKVLLFLWIPKERIEGFDLDIAKRLASPLFWKGVKEVTGGAPLMQIGFSGHGRIPIERVVGVEYGEVGTWRVRLPPDMTTIPVEDPWMFDIDRRVPLADLIALAKRRLAPIKRAADAAKVFKLLDALDRDIEAAEAMREGVDKKDIAVLVGLLDDPAFPRRHDVAEALVWIGDAGFDALRVALVSKNVVRRRGAAFAHAWAATSEDMDPGGGCFSPSPRPIPGSAGPRRTPWVRRRSWKASMC